jgi:isovaleryl-CoA dehydrogenase
MQKFSKIMTRSTLTNYQRASFASRDHFYQIL